MSKQKKPKISNFSVSIDQKIKQKSQEIFSIENAYFPYRPYPQQIQVIQTVNQCIRNSSNALIQSPTGTGKTLCLLVGALSALNTMKNKNIKIFYLTRTHSQINQVIQQLKKTCYQVRVNITASRDHLCIHPNLSQLKGRTLQKACTDYVNNKTCLFKQQQQKSSHPLIIKRTSQPLQLQSFKQKCKNQIICPYFSSRQLTQKTQITILPFNYFLDWKIFSSFSKYIKNSIIIFDQAHNVDSIAEEGANLEVECRVLNGALSQLRQLEKKYKFQKLQQNNSNKNQVKICYQMLERLKNSIIEEKSRIFVSKREIQEYFQRSTEVPDPYDITSKIDGLDLTNNFTFFQRLHRVQSFFYKKQLIQSNFSNIINSLEKLCMLFQSRDFEKDFIAKISSPNNSIQQPIKGSPVSSTSSSQSFRLKCLTPSISFSKILEYSPRSMLLSSGTLGNFQKWQSYLRIPFAHQLSIQSFITPKQLFASILSITSSFSQHSNHIYYNFNYQNKDNLKQYKNVVQQLSKMQKVIPKGNGIVVAFSTYGLMENVIRQIYGERNGGFGKLEKKVFYQIKGGDVAKVFRQYSQQVLKNGAFLFIIMKGRFSQGINFTDELCRCLIVVGIPYLPRNQTNIKQKMSYLKQNYSQQQSQQWYKNQTFQAVNQTIGRVIRNKKDYGVILLIDGRYQKKENFQLLSKWFKKCLLVNSRNQHQQEGVYDGIRRFFEEKRQMMDRNNQSNINNISEQQSNNDKKTNNKIAQKIIKKMVSGKKRLKLRYDSQQKQQKQKGKLNDEEPVNKLEKQFQQQIQLIDKQQISSTHNSQFITPIKPKKFHLQQTTQLSPIKQKPHKRSNLQKSSSHSTSISSSLHTSNPRYNKARNPYFNYNNQHLLSTNRINLSEKTKLQEFFVKSVHNQNSIIKQSNNKYQQPQSIDSFYRIKQAQTQTKMNLQQKKEQESSYYKHYQQQYDKIQTLVVEKGKLLTSPWLKQDCLEQQTTIMPEILQLVSQTYFDLKIHHNQQSQQQHNSKLQNSHCDYHSERNKNIRTSHYTPANNNPNNKQTVNHHTYKDSQQIIEQQKQFFSSSYSKNNNSNSHEDSDDGGMILTRDDRHNNCVNENKDKDINNNKNQDLQRKNVQGDGDTVQDRDEEKDGQKNSSIVKAVSGNADMTPIKESCITDFQHIPEYVLQFYF